VAALGHRAGDHLKGVEDGCWHRRQEDADSEFISKEARRGLPPRVVEGIPFCSARLAISEDSKFLCLTTSFDLLSFEQFGN
jgi:hypothetical protein